MIIPLIPRDPESNDFTCRDGEIEFMTVAEGGTTPPDDETGETGATPSPTPLSGYDIRYSLTPYSHFPTARIRVALQEGDSGKAALMLGGEISRVDAATADRLTQAIVQKAAEEFAAIIKDSRRLGLFLLPFRVYSVVLSADGKSGYPSAQAVMLPCETPPHPEITASSITDDTLTLSLRFPVRPHRLTVTLPTAAGARCVLQTFISYPLYVPDPKETSGSIGSVRSATEGNATGIRFSFLSSGNMRSAVAAPEKYYLLSGNERTGYRMSAKAAPPPDYSIYATEAGLTRPFPAEALKATESDIDPLDWIADWEESGDGYLPANLPYVYRSAATGGSASERYPEGVDGTMIESMAEAGGMPYVLLTRPMTLAAAEASRRRASATAIGRLLILGLPDARCLAVLLGSDDGKHYQPMRRFDPHLCHTPLSPPRLFWRLAVMSEAPFGAMALEVLTGVNGQ